MSAADQVSPCNPPTELSNTRCKVLTVIAFCALFGALLIASLAYSQSTVSGFTVMGGFLLPDGKTTSIDDIRVAGLPPWLEYQVHSYVTGGHCCNAYTLIDYPRTVVNILWCGLLSLILIRYGRHVLHRKDR